VGDFLGACRHVPHSCQRAAGEPGALRKPGACFPGVGFLVSRSFRKDWPCLGFPGVGFLVCSSPGKDWPCCSHRHGQLGQVHAALTTSSAVLPCHLGRTRVGVVCNTNFIIHRHGPSSHEVRG
jgi:hypothetical protein